MNRTSLVIGLTAAMLATVGCSSKNYVKQETTPLINKTNELDDLTAKNTNAIKDVDARAQAGIQQVNAKTAEVDQKAQAAGQQAAQAQTLADSAVHRVDSLTNTVANLDNYHVANETSVQFAFDKDNLSKDAKAALDQLALSPQCGFASGEYADTMTEAQQEAKLRMMGQVAHKVWPNG